MGPRLIEFEPLISTLIAEHTKMKDGLRDVKKTLDEGEYAKAQSILKELKTIFRQHIANEEAQVLRVLVGAYGIAGANEAVEVFRQHRPIYSLMETVERYSALSPEELKRNQTDLRGLFDRHTRVEEERIFPWAVATQREKASTK